MQAFSSLNGSRGEGHSYAHGGDCSSGDDSTPSNFGGCITESVAVVGFSLKFPQEATSAESFWHMMEKRSSAMTEIPQDRFNIDAFYHPDTSRYDTLPLRGGHFLQENLSLFDAPFFSITPSEAVCMDPQQRGMLETTYRALENAGISIEDCYGTNTSVHTGSFTDDYRSVLLHDPDKEHKYAAAGLSASMLANRISWFFDFKGPCMNVDSACSSSMTALHLACQGLRNKETSMGIVGGCNLCYHPDFMRMMSNFNFLSPDSRCWSFDHRANGYARGEGFGVVVVKRLLDALNDGNTIRAVIRATSLNQDGRTLGITQPNKEAQKSLIESTYRKAKLDMAPTRFFEAHGTGTPVGDPIEAAAISEAFRLFRSEEDPLYIGAVKSNIGHLEGGSGVAGLIKTIMILERGIILPNAGFEKLNPRIDPCELRIKFPIQSIPWPSHGLRRACINSFGFGGSNAVVILDDTYHSLETIGRFGHHRTVEAPYAANAADLPYTDPDCHGNHAIVAGTDSKQVLESTLKLLVLSASDKDGIRRLCASYQTYLKDNGRKIRDQSFDDLIYTLTARRSQLTWRYHFTVRTAVEFEHLDLLSPTATQSSSQRKVAFLFSGQGAQYAQMGKDLLNYPVFQETFMNAENELFNIGSHWSLKEILFQEGNQSLIDDPEYSQPLCTVLQIALVDLLRSFSIVPIAVVGHSSGEIAAAYCTGALSLAAAIKIAYHRGRLVADLGRRRNNDHAMMSVGISEDEINTYFSMLEQRKEGLDVEIGCVNSPSNVTVTGDRLQIDILHAWLAEASIFTSKLRVNVAYHSRHMLEITDDYLDTISCLQPRFQQIPQVQMISTVTGDSISNEKLGDPQYWAQNLQSQVKFSEAVSLLCRHSGKKQQKQLGLKKYRPELLVTDLLEIGPHAVLKRPIQETLGQKVTDGAINYFPTLVRHQSASRSLMDTAGSLWCHGYPVDLLAVNSLPSTPRTLTTDLPEYPFDHSKGYWLESRTSRGLRFRKHAWHDLLGTPSSDWNQMEAQWRNYITTSTHPWAKDHKIDGSVLYPAGAILAMAVEAAKQLVGNDREVTGYHIRDVRFLKALQLSSGPDGVETRFSLSSPDASPDPRIPWSKFRLFAFQEDVWIECCQGEIRVDEKPISGLYGQETAATIVAEGYRSELKMLSGQCRETLQSAEMYRSLQSTGTEYGPYFQTIDDLSFNSEGKAVANVKTQQWAAINGRDFAQSRVIHPTTLDGIVQMAYPALSEGGRKILPTMVPTRIRKLWVSSVGLNDPALSTVRAFADSQVSSQRGTTSRICALSSSTGDLRVAVEGYETTFVTTGEESSRPQAIARQLCCTLEWKPDPDLMTNEQVLLYYEQSQLAREPPEQFYRDLFLVIRSFITETLKAMKDGPSSDRAPHLAQYFQWMEHQEYRASVGELTYDQREWSKMVESDFFRDSAIHRVENSGQEGKFYVTVGKNLTKVLRGELDPLEMLFTGDLASDLYQESLLNSDTSSGLRAYLDLLAHKNPVMAILEIGAGTGGTTGACLDVLAGGGSLRCSKYDYTDISSGFLANAEEKFQRHLSRMRFKTLDIELDPLEQGFLESSYDIVIASNVFHATKDLTHTLRHTRKLLKRGGKLILIEITEPHKMRIGFAFGLLKQWWGRIGTQAPGHWSPCLSAHDWNESLGQNGFSGVDVLIPNFRSECHESSLIISTATDTSSNTVDMPSVAIICDKNAEAQYLVARNLCKRIEEQHGAMCEILTLQEYTLGDMSKPTFCIYLAGIDDPLLHTLTPTIFAQLQKFVTSANSILWIVRKGWLAPENLAYSMVDGFSRTLRTEEPRRKLVKLALDRPLDTNSERVIIDILERTVGTSVANLEPEYEERDGFLHVNRIVQAIGMNKILAAKVAVHQRQNLALGQASPLLLSLRSPGLLGSLEYCEDKSDLQQIASDEVMVQVKAIGLSFRDYQIAAGQLNENELGMECSGIILKAGAKTRYTCGEKVYLTHLPTTRTHITCKCSSVAKIPSKMSFIEAASIPTSALISYFALVQVARLAHGESVLIRHGAGNVGQMAVQIAKHIGAKTYVTTSSKYKENVLKNVYGLPEDHIFSDDGTSLVQSVMRTTSGRGVDVVLNSHSEDDSLVPWKCVAPFGRLLAIGSRTDLSDVDFSATEIPKNVTLAVIDLADIIRERPTLLTQLFNKVSGMVDEGDLRPATPLNVFQGSEIEQALRFFQDREHCGKSIIELSPDVAVPVVVDTKATCSFDTNATYVIAGGLGGLGRCIARWMASRGARNMILLSRSGAKSRLSKTLISDLRLSGVNVEVPACDIAQYDVLKKVIDECLQRMPSIKGCVQSTMVLRDSIFQNMTYDFFKESTQPKVYGSWNLHKVMPRGLDFFVLLSSIAGVIGASSQSNYCAGNTYQDALAHYRVTHGEKAVSIDLGMMVLEGVVAETDGMLEALRRQGIFMEISPRDLLALLDYYCNPELEILTSSDCQPLIGIEVPSVIKSKGCDVPDWMCRPLFSHLHQIGFNAADGPTISGSPCYSTLLAQLSSMNDATSHITEWFTDKISRVLGIAVTDVKSSKPVHSYGVDSMVAIELRNWMNKEIGADIAVFDILGLSTLAELCHLAATKSRFVTSSMRLESAESA